MRFAIAILMSVALAWSGMVAHAVSLSDSMEDHGYVSGNESGARDLVSTSTKHDVDHSHGHDSFCSAGHCGFLVAQGFRVVGSLSVDRHERFEPTRAMSLAHSFDPPPPRV